jgi:transcriptional antiterminator NusG
MDGQFECEGAGLVAWYAIRVKPHFEQTVSTGLRGKGYEEFLPLQSKVRRESHRTRSVTQPLFPGYVFSRFDHRNRLPILTIPGVFQIVASGREPAAVSDREIDSLRRVLDSPFPAQSCPYLDAGAPVRITSGPLTGVEGLVTETKGRLRVVVSVRLLQRSVAVEVDTDSVCPRGCE